MGKWGKRVRGALGMGVTWAILWAMGGLIIGVSSKIFPMFPWNSFFEIFDAPLPALGVPGFAGGIIFSIVLGVAARRRKFSELSVGRFAAWGAAGGLLLSLIPAALVGLGLANGGGSETGLGTAELTAVIAPPLMVLSSISAAVSLLLARRAADKKLSAREVLDSIGEGDVQSSILRRDKSVQRL